MVFDGLKLEKIEEGMMRLKLQLKNFMRKKKLRMQKPVIEAPAAPTFPASPWDSTTQQREQTPVGVDPLGPSGHLRESVINKLQAEFKRARANRFQADLEKAQAENARLLTLLQQALSKPKP
ncbi:hypothetical protein Dimus_011149 [Dionaea muscipula]